MVSFLGDTTLTIVLTSALLVFALAYFIIVMYIIYKATRASNTSSEPQVSDEHMHAVTVNDVNGMVVLQPDGKMVVGISV